MAIPVGVILIWDGANGAIPTGWVRETSLDGKFPKAWGASVAPNVSGGANTHSHSAGHTHTLTAHHHTYATDWSNEWTAGDYSGQSADGGESILCAKHKHDTATNTTTDISGGSLQSTTVTWTTVDHQPAYRKVIFIKPNSAPAPLHNGICAHYKETTAPLGYALCDGNNGTQDFRNKFLKGADTGGDAGGTGGDTKHQHTVTHGHTANAHSHTGLTVVNSNPYGARQSQATTGHATTSHQHLTTLANATDTIANYTKTDAGVGDTVEPAYKKIHLVKNIQGGVNEKAGLIGLWLGAVGDIPTNWALCDGNNNTLDLRDKYLKIALDGTEINGTGGSNTHQHTAVSHTHSPNGSHTHTGSTGGALTSRNRRSANQGQGIVLDYDTHAINTISSVTASYSTDSLTSGDAVSNEPAYLTVAYIQLLRVVENGASAMACL